MKNVRRVLWCLAATMLLAMLVGIFASPSKGVDSALSVIWWAEDHLKNTLQTVNIPIWQITTNKSAVSVYWEDYYPNPRFAIYDPNCDTVNKNQATWVDDLVLDKETGLVWQRVPSTDSSDWYKARENANELVLGNRKGWRVPTVEEFGSLVDPTQTNPALPEGSPFKLALDSYYWSATTYDKDPNFVYLLHPGNGGYPMIIKSSGYRLWAVRGGFGHDGQYASAQP